MPFPILFSVIWKKWDVVMTRDPYHAREALICHLPGRMRMADEAEIRFDLPWSPIFTTCWLTPSVMIRARASVARPGGGVYLDASAKSPALVQRCTIVRFRHQALCSTAQTDVRAHRSQVLMLQNESSR